ncbi:hypothetical protein [Tautonia rosea]|uniref:hypothetical protein n=1 Tax=Tautonia rosea TaxID=2728037 RepID=UPI00147350C0|nr:hypothetical protein [Tautonia rosea]
MEVLSNVTRPSILSLCDPIDAAEMRNHLLAGRTNNAWRVVWLCRSDEADFAK